MITRLKLRNWKSHLDSEFNFSPGVNALVGIVGSGKSSIMQAISFGLFGTLPIVQSRKIGLGDLIMRRPQQKKAAEVELEFRVGEDAYLVRRVLDQGKGTSEAEVRKNGALLDVNAKNVSREIEKALQMDYELFSRAVYSEQNELDHFLRIPRGKRMAHIDRMLKVDRFEKVREQAVTLRNRIKEQVGERVKLVEEMEKEGIGEKLKEVSGEMENLGKERKGLESKRDKAAREREGLERSLEELERKQEELEETRAELKSIRELAKEVQGRLKERKRIDVRDIGRMVSEFREKLGKVGEELESRTKEMGELNARIRIVSESIEELDKVEGKCPVCDNSVTPEKKGELIEAREGKEKELRDKVKGTVELMRKAREKKEGLEKRLMELQLEKSRQEETKEMESRLGEHLAREKELLGELEEREKVFSKENVLELREKLKKIVGEESKVLERISGLGALLQEKGVVLGTLKKRQELLERYRTETGMDEKVMEELGGFVQALGATQEQLRQEFVKTVNHIMGEVWQELYPYGDFDGIRLVIDGDYILQLNSAEGWVNVEGAVSGGERSIACLALRIAFSRAFIPNLRWLILDEPTHNLDARAIEQLSAVLQERIGAFAQQVFLITHEERISEGVHTLYRLERDKGRNEPTRVVAG
ncbi:MAG: AAA family ATPase [Candidatus Aenigmatarchaeota archaeon]